MLSEFRVHELKELLRKVGQSQRGKKAELFQRANEILRHGSPKIQAHIHDIHQNCRPYKSPHRSQLSKNLKIAQQMIESRHGYVVHPDVKFKLHPFFKLLETVIRPTALGNVYKGQPPKEVCSQSVLQFPVGAYPQGAF